jgi:hypothetical protein
MDIPPITVGGEKKPGRPKKASWEDDFEDEFIRRLRNAEGEEALDAECKYLADWFAKRQKVRPAGMDEMPITAGRIKEKLRERDYDAKMYKEERWKNIERLLTAARAFLASYDGEIKEPLPEIETKP